MTSPSSSPISVAERVLMFAGASAVFVYLILRCVHVGFTHDEAVSYSILGGNQEALGTANHHPVNTALMRLFLKITGPSEWSLRMPVLLAFLLYAWYQLKSIFLVRHPLVRIALFTCLFLNPYVLDFFSLARGYGLALGFSAAAIYYLFLQHKDDPPPVIIRHFVWSMMAGLAACFSNYAFLNLAFAITCGHALFLFPVLKKAGTINLRQRIELAAAVLITGVGVISVVNRILELDQHNQLYFGGTTGFIPDTIVSLLRGSVYHISWPDPWYQNASALIVFSFLVLVAGNVFRPLMRGPFISIWILILLVLVVNTQFRILHTRLPEYRTALMFVPLFWFALLSGIDRIMHVKVAGALAALLLMAGSMVFTAGVFVNANLDSTREWGLDAHIPEALEIVNRRTQYDERHPDQIVFSHEWFFEPNLNYYRSARELDYLAPFNRDGVAETADYLFIHQDYLKNNPDLLGKFGVIATWDHPRDCLLERKEPVFSQPVP